MGCLIEFYVYSHISANHVFEKKKSKNFYWKQIQKKNLKTISVKVWFLNKSEIPRCLYNPTSTTSQLKKRDSKDLARA
jgi:hypothetical protein